MDTTIYKLKVIFITSVLGTQPNKDVATEYITSKAVGENGNLPEDELLTLPNALQKGTTGFHRLNGQLIYYDYMVKGFLKEAGMAFNGLRGVKNLRSKLDNFVFVIPRQIELHLPEGTEMSYCERPLRAMTMQGPRTSVARSEELPAGTWFDCQLKVYNSPISMPLLQDLLRYGADKGFGQWRNGGHGRFEFALE